MLPRSVFEMPFCIKTSVNICVIRTVSYVSANGCVIVLSPGRGFGAFSHMISYSDDLSFSAFLPRIGDLILLKNSIIQLAIVPRGHVALLSAVNEFY